MASEFGFHARELAWSELSLMRSLGILPERFEGARILPTATRVYDSNGKELFFRVSFVGTDGDTGYADIAADAALGEPLLATAQDVAWDEAWILDQATTAARNRFGIDTSQAETRFVAYSYPKLAVQFLIDGAEVLLLELFSWVPVPPATKRVPSEAPSNFERWSMLDEMPAATKRENRTRFEERVASTTQRLIRDLGEPQLDAISARTLRPLWTEVEMVPLVNTWELHFSTRTTTHKPCFELIGQVTSVWCVAASVQMLLEYYRYEYSQVRIAQELGLGTINNPNGLPYANSGDVVTVLQKLTSGALTAHMNQNPDWGEFRTELRANRPLISFISGHSRAVAGFTESRLALLNQPPFRGLLVYDPWPPTHGVITRWENFSVPSYRVTFAARVKLV